MDDKRKMEYTTRRRKNKFAHVCPDFVIELKSKADDMDGQNKNAKMDHQRM